MMKKRLIGLLFAVLLCLSLPLPALASNDSPLLVDDADLLTGSEENKLLAKLEKISKEQQMDIVVVTTDSLQGKTPQDFADDFFDYNSYADDGILLLVSMEYRDWHITTTGYGVTAVTDAGLEYMSEQFVDDLSDGDYYDAFATYAELCDEFVDQARSGEPYDTGNLPKGAFRLGKNLLISFAIGLVIALIATGVMKGKLKTARFQTAAADYVKSGSMDVTRSNDLFLYRNISRRAKPKESSSGGSRTHTSSSGRSHGGGGGKF